MLFTICHEPSFWLLPDYRKGISEKFCKRCLIRLLLRSSNKSSLAMSLEWLPSYHLTHLINFKYTFLWINVITNNEGGGVQLNWQWLAINRNKTHFYSNLHKIITMTCTKEDCFTLKLLQEYLLLRLPSWVWNFFCFRLNC